MSNQFVMRSVVPLTLLLLLLLLLHLAQGRDLQQQGNSTVFISSRRDLKRAVSTLSSGDVLDFRTQRIKVSRTFDIYERNVTIRSRLESGTTIECDGSREAAVFRIYNGDVRFSRVHFEGCANAPISIQVEDDDDPIVFDRVEFRRNQGVGPFGRGGAVLIVGCASSGCRVVRTFPPTVIIQRCTFQSNLATLGGAIFADNVNLTISESTFDSNEAERRGGAVYITGVRSTLALERTSFKNNTIRRSGNDLEVTLERGLPLEVLRYIRFPFPDAVGGAVSIHSIVQTTVDECHFRHNRAPAGGAIATETLLEAKRGALDPSFSVFINNSTFEENTAAFAEPMSSSQVSMGLLGGAIYSLSTDRDFSWEALNCSFERNMAHDGGAIHIVTHRLSTPSIHGSTFLDNEATSFGGALLLRNMGAMDIRDCVFEGNGARSGGAVFVTNNALCFVRGLAGLPPDPRTGNRTIFVRNRAERGGAIGCLACSDLIIQDALFMQNEGRTEGGGLYVYDSDAMVSILQATFDGNWALKGGGAFFDHVTVVRLTAAAQSLATVFSNNEAISGSAVSYAATHPKENRFLMANVEVLSNRELPADIMAQSASVVQGGGTVDLVLDLVPSFAVADILLDNVTINDNIARRGGGVRIEAEGQWNEQVIFRCPSTRFRADPCRLLRFVDVRIVNNRAIEGAGLLVTDGQTLSLLCWSDAQMSFTSLSGILLDNDHQNTDALNSNCTYIDNNFITLMCLWGRSVESKSLRSVFALPRRHVISSKPSLHSHTFLRFFGMADRSLAVSNRSLTSLKVAVLSQRCCNEISEPPFPIPRPSHPQKCSFSSSTSGKDPKGGDTVDGLASETGEEIVKAKFGDDEPNEEISEDLARLHQMESNQSSSDSDQSMENVSESGFSLDYLAVTQSSSSSTREGVRSEELCEEGFCLDYLTPISQRHPASILDQIRKGLPQRRQREWRHMQETFERPMPLPNSFADFHLPRFKDEPEDNRETIPYRVEDQRTLQERRASIGPLWRINKISDAERMIDRVDYMEIGEGGKLGNKICEIQLTVEQMRADTIDTIWRKRQEEAQHSDPMTSNISVETLESLKEKCEAQKRLRALSGVEYHPFLLLMVGTQGSGKSKFSFDLVEHGVLPWARINQDTIRNGRRGTKSDCVMKAHHMLQHGYCVMIDRMNFSVQQRDEFVTLAKKIGCAIHAIVFRLPFVENVYHVAQRRNHEGHFEGSSDLHRQIIYYTRCRLFNGGHPKENNEGFNSVFECRSNEDYAFAFRQWMNVGRKGTDGHRMTVDAWKGKQQPWRIASPSELKETADIILQEQIWRQKPRFPFMAPLDLDADLPVQRRPSLGSPVESDDDDEK